jgi:hypothetical protein
LNQHLQQFTGVCFERLTNFDKFHDVDSPLTALIFGDEGLRSTKALGELMLRQVSSFARLDHQFAEDGLFRGMDGFVEFARASGHRRGTLIRTSDYPKKGYFDSVALLLVLPLDFPAAGSELPSTASSEGRQMAQTCEPKRTQPPDAGHYAESSARENLIEHVFLGELLRARALAQERAGSGGFAARG